VLDPHTCTSVQVLLEYLVLCRLDHIVQRIGVRVEVIIIVLSMSYKAHINYAPVCLAPVRPCQKR
jgi:hypothetical protein